MLTQSQQTSQSAVSYAINDHVLIKLVKLECFQLGHVAAQEQKKNSIHLQGRASDCPHPGTVCHQKCCVIYI